MTIYKIRAGRVPGINFNTGFVGVKDTMFYDTVTGELRISDGLSHGGVPLTFNNIKINFNWLSDLTIPGGTNGQVLTTDGVGNLSWTNGSHILPSTAPATPASGWVIYVDSGDGNKLKAKASTGTIVTLGTP